MTPGGPTLLCTDTVAERYAEQLFRAAPALELVPLVGDGPVPDADLARVDAAYLSADCFPARSGKLLGAALRAPNLRWLHTFSAGTPGSGTTIRQPAARGVAVVLSLASTAA